MDFKQIQAFLADNTFHLMLAVALAGLTVAIVVGEVKRLLRPYKALGPAQLTALINREDALVVDLSPQGDFEKGHIAGSKSLPAAQFKPDHRLLTAARTRPLVLACRTGQASAAPAAALKKAGFEQVYWLDGGIEAWKSADLPLAKGRA
ncbi:MAG: rhodanese-like domain-containing protein [Pseudoxanthomonas sp.]